MSKWFRTSINVKEDDDQLKWEGLIMQIYYESGRSGSLHKMKFQYDTGLIASDPLRATIEEAIQLKNRIEMRTNSE